MTAAYPQMIEAACVVMHDAYEKAAVEAGWATQKQSRVPWSAVPESNKATMRVAVAALYEHWNAPDKTFREQVGMYRMAVNSEEQSHKED